MNDDEEDLSAENGVTQVYNTMDIFIFQTFFDKLSSDFIPGLLWGLENVKFKNINGTIPLLDQELVFNYELNETHVSSASIEQAPPLVKINDDGSITLAVDNLNLSLVSNYSYISDPPIFADIGEGSLHLVDMSMSADLTSTVHPFQIELSNLKVDSHARPFCEFDGISDFSQVATNVVNTVVAVVRNRIESFIDDGEHYHVDEKLQAIINKILGLVEFPISLGDNGLYLDGVFYSDIVAGNDLMVLPLNAMLRYDNATYDSSVCSF